MPLPTVPPLPAISPFDRESAIVVLKALLHDVRNPIVPAGRSEWLDGYDRGLEAGYEFALFLLGDADAVRDRAIKAAAETGEPSMPEAGFDPGPQHLFEAGRGPKP